MNFIVLLDFRFENLFLTFSTTYIRVGVRENDNRIMILNKKAP